MIIIAENKKNHYLLKNFFKEISKVRLNESLRQDQAGEHTALDINALDLNDTVVDQNPLDTEIVSDKEESTVGDKVLKKAAFLEPRMNRLLNAFYRGLKISAIAAALFFSGDSNEQMQALKKIAVDNNIQVSELEKITSQPSNNQTSQTANQYNTTTSITDDSKDTVQTTLQTKPKQKEKVMPSTSSSKLKLLQRSKRRIKTFEGFKPYPYKAKSTETGVTIGYGTFFIDDVEPDSLPDNWIENLYEKCGISDKEKSKYEQKNQQELLSDFSKTIESKKAALDKIILRVENKIKSKNLELKKWEEIRDPDKRKRYTDTVQTEIERLNKRKASLEDQKADLDAEFELADSRGLISIELAEKCLDAYISNSIDYHDDENDILIMDDDVQDVIIDMSYNVGMYFLEEEFPNFEGFIKEYIEAIKSEDIQLEIEALSNMYEEIRDRSPDYQKQQSSNRRAEKNTNLLKDALESAEKKLQENVYSLKSAYKILFN